MASTITGPLHVTQGFSTDAITLPTNSVGNSVVDPTDPIGTDRLYHLHVKCFGQMDGGSVTQEIRAIHVAITGGSVEQFQCGFRVAPLGDSTCTVDLYKNGVSILSAVPSLDVAHTPDPYDQVIAGIDPTKKNYVAGDVFEVVVTPTDGTGTPGQGLFYQAVFNEGAF